MTSMADESQLRDWAETKNYRQIAIELIQLENERGLISLVDLGEDPERALEDNPEVTIEYDTSPKEGCSVYGYYRYRPREQSIIFVHPALTSERDNFTIVHEYGHHVQRQHEHWANVRHSYPGQSGLKLEERVADAFAAEVLIPAQTAPPDASWLSALTLSEVYGRVRASRAAVAMRAAEIAPSGEQAVVVVADSQGLVTFARACGDDIYTPARGLVQPSVARLIEQALSSGGHTTGSLTEGIQFGSGWAQQDLTAEVAINHSGNYAFIVIRSAQRFGRRPIWDRVEHECPRSACELVSIVDESISFCEKCNTPKCPDCGGCECEPVPAAVCELCFMELSVAEQANLSKHVCDF